MAAERIPVIEVKGTHRQVGQQIGEQMRRQLHRIIASLHQQQNLPPGVTWEEMIQKAHLCLSYSRAAYPQYVEELVGIAEGADLPFDEVFLWMCEEFWRKAAWRGGGLIKPKGCTDFAARGRATADGATLLAHTNDLSRDTEQNLVILKVQAGDEPEFLAVSVGGLGYSAGFNAAGISLTGNEVSSNDVCPGVPRQLMVRAILAARRLGEAMAACLLPQRASNYNNIIADTNGEVYSVEGSATDVDPLYIEGDVLAHANHYVSPHMRRFESDRSLIYESVVRHNRALRLLREHYGQITPELLRTFLTDHANYPASICRHAGDAITVFSMVIHLNDLRAWIGRGLPCQTTFYEYALEAWTPPADWALTANKRPARATQRPARTKHARTPAARPDANRRRSRKDRR
jgi:isopenicillin-N N-acyltransferase-like protein